MAWSKGLKGTECMSSFPYTGTQYMFLPASVQSPLHGCICIYTSIASLACWEWTVDTQNALDKTLTSNVDTHFICGLFGLHHSTGKLSMCRGRGRVIKVGGGSTR